MSTSPGPSEQPPTAPEPSLPAAPAPPPAPKPPEPATKAANPWWEFLIFFGCMFGGIAAVHSTGALDYADGPGHKDGFYILFPMQWPGASRYTIGLLTIAGVGLILTNVSKHRPNLKAVAVLCFLVATLWGLILAEPDVRRAEFLTILIATSVMLGCAAPALRQLRKRPPAPETRPPSESHRTP